MGKVLELILLALQEIYVVIHLLVFISCLIYSLFHFRDYELFGCSAAQLAVRWLAVRQARVRISARHPRKVPPTEPAAMKFGEGPQRMS